MTPGNVGDNFDRAECVDLVPVGAVKPLQCSGSVEENTAFLLEFMEDLRLGAAEAGGEPGSGHLYAVALKQRIPGAKV
jgi:hypothetical protein